ncbi:MAG TPA: DUF4136 domain-containing protein [Candidatus Methylomirabilis sp.]|nr:DUF4136 domain-containing protein [Candidatus Methylomirabilis sp.]
MRYLCLSGTAKGLVTAAVFFSLIFATGCNERVRITRDRDVRIPKGATWAWRPAVSETASAAPASARGQRDDRPVTSRDLIGRNQAPNPNANPNAAATREPSADDEVVRQRVRQSIESTLASKGFRQVNDPAAAEFLADYKFAVRGHNATVPVAYGGAYPGLVCGPFRCWESWGWGPAAVGYENIHFREGTIVFDFVQQPTKHLVYRAIGEKPVRRDAFTLTQGDINGLVHLLLEELKHH